MMTFCKKASLHTLSPACDFQTRISSLCSLHHPVKILHWNHHFHKGVYLFLQVAVEAPPAGEQLAILEAMFPPLAPLLHHALAMLAVVQGSAAVGDRCSLVSNLGSWIQG